MDKTINTNTENQNREYEDNLFIEEQLQRHTKLGDQEIPIFNVLLEFGKQIDNHRSKFYKTKYDSDHKSVLTRISNTALRLRTSKEGWRSNQVVEISQNKLAHEKDKNMGFGEKISQIINKK